MENKLLENCACLFHSIYHDEETVPSKINGVTSITWILEIELGYVCLATLVSKHVCNRRSTASYFGW